MCDEIISQGGDVAEIDRWYASGWDGHICGLPFNNFDLPSSPFPLPSPG
jgi:hypothetical protein